MNFERRYFIEPPSQEEERESNVCFYLYCKYTVLTEQFDQAAGLNVNPWRHGECNRHAILVSKEIEEQCLRLGVGYEKFKNNRISMRKYKEPTYEYCLDYFEKNKNKYEVNKVDIAPTINNDLRMLNS